MKGIELARQKRQNAINGIANCLPMPFPKLRKKIAGFNRGLHTGISASSGVGKTTLSKFILIYFVDWAIQHNIELHIRMYLLEESAATFESTVLTHKLHMTKGERISLDEFNSNEKALSEKTLKKLEDIERDYMTQFRQYVTIIDTLDNPNEIYEDAVEAIKPFGILTTETNPKTGKEYEKSFTLHNPKAFHALFLDNLNELASFETDLNGCIKKWGSLALKKLCKVFDYSVFSIIQQSAAQESVDNVKLNRLKPSLNGLGDCKLIGRSLRLCIGLFSPYRNDIAKYNNHVIVANDDSGYEDYYRSLNIFKNNFGVSNIEDSLYFDGMVIDLKETDSFVLRNKPKEN